MKENRECFRMWGAGKMQLFSNEEFPHTHNKYTLTRFKIIHSFGSALFYGTFPNSNIFSNANGKKGNGAQKYIRICKFFGYSLSVKNIGASFDLKKKDENKNKKPDGHFCVQIWRFTNFLFLLHIIIPHFFEKFDVDYVITSLHWHRFRTHTHTHFSLSCVSLFARAEKHGLNKCQNDHYYYKFTILVLVSH